MKLYVLVRGDLSPGDQLAQVAHASAKYVGIYPRNVPDTVVVLEVEDDAHLEECRMAMSLDIAYVVFYEPHFSEYTAIAVKTTGEEYAHLPLAGRGKAAMTVS